MSYNKHQSACYRYFKGVKYINYSDLVYSEIENNKIVSEAKRKFNSVRVIKRRDGSSQLFVPHRPA